MNKDQEGTAVLGRTYAIMPRPSGMGSGWTLVMFEDGEEAGGGVFPVSEEHPEVGIGWWNALPVEERSYWLVKAESAVAADARHAYLLAVAYDDATDTGEDWIGNP